MSTRREFIKLRAGNADRHSLDPTTPSHRPALQAVEAVGQKLGVQLLMVPARTIEDFDGAFATMARERVGGFLVVAAPLTASQRAPLADLALKRPAAGDVRDQGERGGGRSHELRRGPQ